MALAGALCTDAARRFGITNKSLRALMTGLLHAPYSTGQMTYDLRRLRLAGLIRRIERTNRYVLTADGLKMAVFYTKLHNRVLRPLLAADQPQAAPELRAALRTIDQHIGTDITCARISQAARKLDTNVHKLGPRIARRSSRSDPLPGAAPAGQGRASADVGLGASCRWCQSLGPLMRCAAQAQGCAVAQPCALSAPCCAA